ncbi:MAG: NAD-dependent epimerase/dehydratase family protein [Ferruginibacter sp.]
MLKIGITGQAGFVGSHLYNFLNLQEGISLINFEKGFFNNQDQLRGFVKQCDVIIHLAAMNRHNDPEVIYKTNTGLVQQLVDALESEAAAPHIIFSSSTQEERDNLYGRSKKEGRELFEKWALKNKGVFTGLVIPNVFGPFGNPYYNSVIATFSHRLTHNETPEIEVDGTLNLIYVAELVEVIWKKIKEKTNAAACIVPHTTTIKVTEILAQLQRFKAAYFEKAIFPALNSQFELNLFNTFRSYIDHQAFFPFFLTKNTDERGSFVETVKLEIGGQVSFSTTKPGVTRGNHFHTRKIERFAVIKGKARIELRKIGDSKVLSFDLDGDKPSFVDMPVWYTHNITNTGDEELYTIFWINEFFNPADPDTFFVPV